MNKINKTRMIIVVIYLLHLIFYVFMSYITEINISNWINIVHKLKINTNITPYNHIYISIYYFILSTHLMFEFLNLCINKKVKILVYATGYVFAFISLYNYYNIKDFISLFLVANGLILSLRTLYKKINDRAS